MRNNYLLAGFTLTVLLSVGTASAADPRLLNLVMPDAATLAGANVTNAKITPFGQYVLAQMTATMNQQLQAFVTATGFDPRQDVSEILAASSTGQTAAGTTTTPSGLVLALGTFPVSQMTAAITAKSPQLTVQTYGGATLIAGTNGGTNAGASFSIAFLGTAIAIAGDTPSVKAAIDRSTGVNSINPALASQVQALSTTEDAWAVTNTPAASLLAGLDGSSGSSGTPATGATSPISQIGQMFNGILSSSGGILFGSNVQITGQAITTDAATAKSLADVLTALVSIAAMSGGQNSPTASFAQLLQGLTVTANGAAINLALSVPEATLENFLNGLKKQTASPSIKPKASIAPNSAPKAIANKAD